MKADGLQVLQPMLGTSCIVQKYVDDDDDDDTRKSHNKNNNNHNQPNLHSLQLAFPKLVSLASGGTYMTQSFFVNSVSSFESISSRNLYAGNKVI